MIRISYQYKNYPDCPKATRFSKNMSLMSAVCTSFAGLPLLVAVLGAIIGIGKYLLESSWVEYFVALFCLIFVSLIVYFPIVLHPHLTDLGIRLIIVKNSKLPRLEYLQARKQIRTLGFVEITYITVRYIYFSNAIILLIALSCMDLYGIFGLIKGDSWCILLLIFSLSATGVSVLAIILIGKALSKISSIITKRTGLYL